MDNDWNTKVEATEVWPKESLDTRVKDCFLQFYRSQTKLPIFTCGVCALLVEDSKCYYGFLIQCIHHKLNYYLLMNLEIFVLTIVVEQQLIQVPHIYERVHNVGNHWTKINCHHFDFKQDLIMAPIQTCLII